MNVGDVLLVGLSLSIDAMVVSSTDGISEPDIRLPKALLIALFFGLFQGMMPALGYLVGYGFQDFLKVAIPWIAFGALTLLSIKSLIDFIKERKAKDEGETDENKRRLNLRTLLFQAIATSIDALCVGFVFLSYPLGEAMASFGIIAATTFALSLAMVYVGKFLGAKIKIFQTYAGLLASAVFLGLAIKLLLEGIF